MKMRKFHSSLLVPAWTGIALCMAFGQAPGKKGGDQAIRVNVEMVSLPVVVTTRDGKRVTDLKKGDFQVFEDKVEQEIAGFAATEEPVSVALMLDTSGSTEEKLARIQNESIRFVNLLHPDDSVAVLSFAEDVNLLEDFSFNRKRNAYGIKETRPGGRTVLYDAVWLALEEVLKPVKERKALVLFTDGVDTASVYTSMKDTLESSKEADGPVYVIYFDTEEDVNRGRGSTIGANPIPGYPPIVTRPPVLGPPGAGSAPSDYRIGREYLRDLAKNSGGRVFDAGTMDDLGPAFEQIARELASQYSIGYYPSNPRHDGKFHKVEVRIKKPGLVARTRQGYYAQKRGKKK